MRHLLLLLVVGCADPVAAAPTSATSSAAPSPISLTSGPAFMQSVVTLTVGGVLAGERVLLAVSDQPPAAGPCYPFLRGKCLDLVGATQAGVRTATVDGDQAFSIVTPRGAAQTRWYQAIVLGGRGVALSAARRVRFLRFSTDSDGDGAYDPIELDRGLDVLDPDVDGDGILDGADIHPTVVDPPTSFVRDDRIVGPRGQRLSDPEFLTDTGRFVWQVADGSAVWLGGIDLATGELDPPDGKGELVATDVAPMDVGKNGVEWALSSTATHVVFSMPDGAGGYVLGAATEDPTGWTVSPMDGPTSGLNPYGTRDPAAPEARVAYLDRVPGMPPPYDVLAGWRPVAGTDEHVLPQELWCPWLRFVDARRLSGGAPVAGWNQLWVWDTDTETGGFITSDPTDKRFGDGWVAPDLGGLAIVAGRGKVVDRLTEAVVYREQGGVFVEQTVIPTPPGHPYLLTPRAFVWKGRSYVTFVASLGTDNSQFVGKEIWLATVTNPPKLRRIDVGDGASHQDAEVVTAGARPWLYYTDYSAADNVLHRCELGLP